MIENEIYCYINGFLKWNIRKKTSYIVGNKKLTGKICVLTLRSKKKVSLHVSSGTMGERRSQRKPARSQLKVPIDEIIGQSLGNISLEENLFILGVAQI